MGYSFLLFSVGILLINCKSTYHSSNTAKECKVMLATIAENYDGFCSNGLAHGEGTASGLHSNEGKLEILSEFDKPQKVVSEQGVVSSNIRRQGINYSDKIVLRFRRNGENVLNIITQLNIHHSSVHMPNKPGSRSTPEYTIIDVNYPLELLVNCKTPT